MVRWEKLSDGERRSLENLSLPIFETRPWAKGLPLNRRRVAIISTAGLHRREDRPFTPEPGDYYRIIPDDIKSGDLITSHVSLGFDRSGFQQDWNIVFPLDRLRELAQEGIIGSVAGFHYSFMGADDPTRWEHEARLVASLLKKDKVDAALLLPV